MTRILEIKTSDAELQQTLSLTTEGGETLTMSQLQTTAASLLPDQKFLLRYMDSDGDHVTITNDADVKELERYMQDDRLQNLEVLAVPQEPTTYPHASSVVQTQLRGLVTAMSKLTAKSETNPTPASAMSLLVASLQAMGVAEDAEELETVKKELLLLLLLQDEAFCNTVNKLSATEEFKELADAMVAAIYEEDAQAIEDAATERFDKLLVFAQRVVARCPSLKPVMVTVAKSLMIGLVRYNDRERNSNASDSPSCSGSSSCCSDDQETVDVEVFAEEVPLHLGVVCVVCEKAPLVGVRYKSLEVPNFDLCEECEASGKYTHYEPFIKITDPSRAPKQKHTSELVHPYVTCDGCEMRPIEGIRFKSQTKENFDLYEACEASGKWTESHGPFTKIEEPAMMRALKFTCRRGGKFGRHGKFGHHHGHHGKFGRHHGCHGKFSRHHDDGHHHGKLGHDGHRHRGHSQFGRHGRHHGSPEFAFHGRHPDHHGPPGFPGHGFPFHHESHLELHGHGRPDFHGHHGHGPPPEFDDRHRHHGLPGCFFGRFGPPPFEFANPRGPPIRPRGFEHGRPPFPAEFEHWGHGFRGHHGHHGCHGRHTRFSNDDDEDDNREEGHCYHQLHGYHGRGRGHWSPDVASGKAGFVQEARDAVSRTQVAVDEDMEIVDTTEAPGDREVVSAESEDKLDNSEALKQLASMGFDDTTKNIRALELADGNIGGAVNALLSE